MATFDIFTLIYLRQWVCTFALEFQFRKGMNFVVQLFPVNTPTFLLLGNNDCQRFPVG